MGVEGSGLRLYSIHLHGADESWPPSKEQADAILQTQTPQPSDKPSNNTMDYKNMTLGALRGLCQQRGIVKGGNKATVIQRLVEHDQNAGTASPSVQSDQPLIKVCDCLPVVRRSSRSMSLRRGNPNRIST